MAALGSSRLLSRWISAGDPRRKSHGGPTAGVPQIRPVRSSMQVDLERSPEVAVKPAAEAPPRLPLAAGALGLDAVAEAELREKGFMGLRKTKLVCTVGPACCSPAQLERLAAAGMNVARLNMCHNSREWHRRVMRDVMALNREKGFYVSLMIDTEGSQTHVVDHGGHSSVKPEVPFACT